jgi:predicted nucleic acid-binding protein
MGGLRLLLVDACVLIDFAKTDISVLTLASRHVGEVHVVTPVFEEVKDIDATMAASLGINLVEPTLEALVQAATERGRLSFQDRLCLLVAKSHGYTCVSNDKQLRATCEAEGVSVMWGFEVLALLVERRALSAADAGELAEKIAASNRRIAPAVLARFFKRIGVKR